MSDEVKGRRSRLLAGEVRELAARGEEILEARRNPDGGKRKWADFADIYDTWNRKAGDLIRKLCGRSLAAKWDLFDARYMYSLDMDRAAALEEQQRKQDLLTEHLLRPNADAAEAVAPAAPATQEGFTRTPAFRAGRPELPERVFRVWRDFQFACSKSGKRAPLDRDLYEWLKVNGREKCTASRLDFDTWTRYLREGRKLLGRQKRASSKDEW